MKFKLAESIVMHPEIGRRYYFSTQGGIRSGIYKGSTKAWHIFGAEDGAHNHYVNIWSNIATSKEDLEMIDAVVDNIEKDTYVPDVVNFPNRFTR